MWDENLEKALTHLLGNCRQSQRGTSRKKMVGAVGAMGAVGVVGALSTLGKDRKKLNYFL